MTDWNSNSNKYESDQKKNTKKSNGKALSIVGMILLGLGFCCFIIGAVCMVTLSNPLLIIISVAGMILVGIGTTLTNLGKRRTRIIDSTPIINQVVTPNTQESLRKCPHCGETLNAGDKFCAKCGGRATVTCPKCGAENIYGSAFCTKCGAQIK